MDPLRSTRSLDIILFKKTVVVAMIRLRRVLLRPSFVRQEILYYWTTEGILVDVEQDSLLPCICDNTSSEGTHGSERLLRKVFCRVTSMSQSLHTLTTACFQNPNWTHYLYELRLVYDGNITPGSDPLYLEVCMALREPATLPLP